VAAPARAGLARAPVVRAVPAPSPGRVAGVERAVAVELGPVVGLELRPTRAFVRLGPGGRLVRVLPLSARPRPLRRPRRAWGVAVGPLRVTGIGSPVLTVGLAGAHALRRALGR